MFNFLKKTNATLGDSDSLVQSAFGVSVVSFVIVFPFAINNFIQGRTIGGFLAMFVALLCVFNAYLGWRGRYALYLNLFGIIPAITLAVINAILSLGIMGSYWAYLGVLSIYFILPFQYAKYSNVIFLIPVIVAAWFSLEPTVYLRFAVVLSGVSFFIFISSREVTNTQKQLMEQSVTDPLTGAFNRVQLTKNLEKAIQNFKNNGITSTLCIVDIDHFKDVNDSFGHDAGDKVLIELSTFIRGMISSKDILFRIGGEEFLILMNNTNEDEGSKTADALRAIVEDMPLFEDHLVTISIGVTEIQSGYTWKEWMKRSDEKLYTAKQNGRNQVVI